MSTVSTDSEYKDRISELEEKNREQLLELMNQRDRIIGLLQENGNLQVHVNELEATNYLLNDRLARYERITSGVRRIYRASKRVKPRKK